MVYHFNQESAKAVGVAGASYTVVPQLYPLRELL
jgi:hypothetical protein